MSEESNQQIIQKLERVATKIVNLNGMTRLNYLLNLEATYREYLATPRNQESGVWKTFAPRFQSVVAK